MTTSKIHESVWGVIVTYNGQAWISGCLTSLLASTYPIKVVVVDNGSSDDTVRFIQEQFKEVKLIESETNLGFGQANNVGIAWALQNKADFVFLLNQDTSVNPDTVENLLGGFREHPEFAILSPLHLNGMGTDFDRAFFKYAQKDYPQEVIKYWLKEKELDIFESDFVNAAAWMVKSFTFQRIGGFSPLFFHYAEDRDYVNRLKFHRHKLGILPAAKIRHYRDDRENNQLNWGYSKRANYYYTAALMQAGDINKSLIGKFSYIFNWLAKDCIYLLFKGFISVPFMFLKMTTKIFVALPKIIEHRKSVKNPSSYLFIPNLAQFGIDHPNK